MEGLYLHIQRSKFIVPAIGGVAVEFSEVDRASWNGERVLRGTDWGVNRLEGRGKRKGKVECDGGALTEEDRGGFEVNSFVFNSHQNHPRRGRLSDGEVRVIRLIIDRRHRTSSLYSLTSLTEGMVMRGITVVPTHLIHPNSTDGLNWKEIPVD